MSAGSTPVVPADAAGIAALCAALAAAPRVALDTEFMRERTYLAELALLQLATPTGVALVDPLAGLDLGPLAALLIDLKRTKVLHAARQDLEVLLPRLGEPLAPVLDTQLAAALLGMPAQIGYGDLVERTLGIRLEKGHARTDWLRRPLSAAQLAYAADDVRYLLPLASSLEEELDRRGRLDWLLADCAALADPALYRVDPAQAWQRLKGIESLPPREQLRLRALARWREERALRRNLPRGWVLSDEGLRSIARAAPPGRAELRALGALPDSAADKLGGEILEALAGAAQEPLDGIVQRADARPDAAEQARTRRLADRLRGMAAEVGIATEVLATQRDLRRLASGERLESVLGGWRRELIGGALAEELARG